MPRAGNEAHTNLAGPQTPLGQDSNREAPGSGPFRLKVQVLSLHFFFFLFLSFPTLLMPSLKEGTRKELVRGGSVKGKTNMGLHWSPVK